MPNTKKDEIAALRAELDALKAKVDPPKSDFVPAPYQRYDPTANMCMPPSALAAMVAAEPKGFMQDVVRDNRGPSAPSSMIPGGAQPASPRSSAGDGSGWAREIPLGPSVHQRYVDQQIDAQDDRDRAERIRQDARLQAMEKVTEQIEAMNKQTEALAKLVGSKKE
jgi:hypothetical protein